MFVVPIKIYDSERRPIRQIDLLHFAFCESTCSNVPVEQNGSQRQHCTEYVECNTKQVYSRTPTRNRNPDVVLLTVHLLWKSHVHSAVPSCLR